MRAPGGLRSRYLDVGNVALYRLSYWRTRRGDGIRTRSNQLGRLGLYQMSFTPIHAPQESNLAHRVLETLSPALEHWDALSYFQMMG